MSRPKKKSSDPVCSMKRLMKRAVSLFEVPYDDRDGREADLPSLRMVAEELGTTILRTRKLLITAGVYSTEMSRTVQEMTAAGRTLGTQGDGPSVQGCTKGPSPCVLNSTVNCGRTKRVLPKTLSDPD